MSILIPNIITTNVDNPEQFFAAALGVTPTVLRALVKEGVIVARVKGGRWYALRISNEGRIRLREAQRSAPVPPVEVDHE